MSRSNSLMALKLLDSNITDIITSGRLPAISTKTSILVSNPPAALLQWIILMRITNTRRSLAKIKCFIFYGLVIISGLSSSQRKILSLFPYFKVKSIVSQTGFQSEISMSPFWSAIRHASVRRRRRLHAVKTFKVGGHHFASLSDKTDQSSGVGDSRKK